MDIMMVETMEKSKVAEMVEWLVYLRVD